MELLPAASDRGHERRRLQNREVLADRLARHVEPGAQLAQRLAVATVEAVEQPAAAGVSQGLEDRVHVMVSRHAAKWLHDYRQPEGCMSSGTPCGVWWCRWGARRS